MMKKILYPIIGVILFCMSFIQQDNKRSTNKRIENQSIDNLILKPFQFLGLLYSCSRDDHEEEGFRPSSDTVTYYPGSGAGNLQPDNSQSHSSHYSEYHNSHSSHYSSSHQSHQSHSSHSSHYSAR